MESTADAAAVTIGRFSFSATALMRAKQLLQDAVGAAWLIADEVGPLGVRYNSGLEPVLSAIIRSYKEKAVAGYLLLVVRDTHGGGSKSILWPRLYHDRFVIRL